MGAEQCFTHVFTVGSQVVTAKVHESSFGVHCTWEPGGQPNLTKLSDGQHREYMQGMAVVEAHLSATLGRRR